MPHNPVICSGTVKVKIALKSNKAYIKEYKGVALKDKATLTGKTLVTVPYATAVTVKSYCNGWAYITYNKKNGYIQNKKLSDTEPVPNS